MTMWRWGRRGARGWPLRAGALIFPVVAGALAGVPAAAQMQQPGWMAGCWERRTATGLGREEWRVTERGLDGGAAVFRGDTLIAWEFLRVDASGYHAAPNRQAAHRFGAVVVTADSAVWADPAHDFPQRIIFRKNGTNMSARIEGMEKGKERHEDFPYTRAKCE